MPDKELEKAYNALKKSYERLQAENSYLKQQITSLALQKQENLSALPDAERKASTEANQKNAILQAIPDHIFILNETGAYIEHYGNTNVEYLTEDIIGKSINEIDLPTWLVESLLTCNQLALHTGTMQLLPYTLPTVYGTKHYEARIIKCGEGLLMHLIRDVTMRRKAEERIKAAEHYKRTLLRLIPDMILVINEYGYFVDVRGNYKSYPLLSYEIGMHITAANLPEDILQKWLLDNQQALLTNKTQIGEYSIVVGREVYYYETQTVRYRKDLVLKIVRDISNRKRAEEQFKAEANRRHSILRAIPDILFLMNDKGDYLDYKGGSGEILMNPNQVVGTNIKNSQMPKSIINQILATNQQALLTGNLQLSEYSLTIEGEERHYESRTIMYAPQQVLRIVRDITEQKKVLQENLQLIVELQMLNEELATSSEEIRQTLDNTVALNENIAKRELYYKALLEVSPDILLCVNEKRQIEFMHVPDTHLAEGAEIEDFLGKDFLDMEIDPEVREKALKAFDYVLGTGRRTSYEAVVQHPTLGQRYYDSYYAPIVASGEVISIYILVKDITTTKESEEKLRNINKDLIRQNNQLAHYSYVVSHNLRSPVASIMGLINLLSIADHSTDEQHELLAMLGTSAQRLDEVVKDLNYILSETQIVEENKETVYFDVEIKKVIEQMHPQIKKCEAEIHYDFSHATTITASKAFINNVFLNVITNSLKFRRSNIITQIGVSTAIIDNYVCLTIRDNGTGIDLTTQAENVFKLYKRFHPNIEGKGIGLYILKTQVEIQGGKVEIESEVDVGTTLNIYFLKES